MLVLSNGTYKVYVRRGVVRVRGANGEEYVVDSTVDAIVVATSRVSLTAKAIRLLAMNGVDVVILAPNGEPVARVYPPIINRTVLARRGQFEAMVNGKGLRVSKVLVKAKLMNQANLLRYLAKARRVEWLKDEAIKLDELALSLDRVNGSEGLIEVEAHAARHYWSAIAQLTPPELNFRGRAQEGGDPLNVMLNYGYGILRYAVEKAILIHGLDPYAGFLHADRSGKPSLTLDVMEPFRPLVDKALLTNRLTVNLVNNYLDYQSRGLVAKTIIEELNGKVNFNGRVTNGLNAINRLVESIASYLRGDGDLVEPVIRWY